MEQSSRYIHALEQTRRMPQGTEEEKIEKREQAALLRQQVLLDNARCAQLLTDFCEHRPMAELQEFTDVLHRDDVLAAHPETIEVFIGLLQETAADVTGAMKKLGRDYPDQAKELFRWAAGEDKRGYHIQGAVDVDTTYPLALILYVENSEDFQKIDTRANIGGFYNPSIRLSAQTGMKHRVIPLIVVRGRKHQKDYIRQHEVGHSHNDMLKSGMDLAKKKFIWANIDRLSLDSVKNLETAAEKSPDSLKESPVFRDVVAIALARAKDEILADSHARNGRLEYVPNLLVRGGTYDYFAKELKITPDSTLYKEAWREYEMRLQCANDCAAEIIGEYQREPFRLTQRAEIFRWVLAQIPIDQWQRQLEGTLFRREMSTLRGIARMMPESANGEPPRHGMWAQLLRVLRDHQHESLLPYLGDFLSHLDARRVDDAERHLMLEIELEQFSAEFYHAVRQGRMTIWSVPSKLRRVYDRLCEEFGMDPLSGFMDVFLREQGWSEETGAR